MPLTIVVEKNKWKPVFICDYCGREISDAFDGNYEWNRPEDAQQVTDIKFLHKACSRLYGSKYGTLECSMGIHNLMVYLLNNLSLTPDRLEEAHRNTEALSQFRI